MRMQRGTALKIDARAGSIYCGDIVDGERHGYLRLT
jgi:hypothetical protein